MTLYFLVFFLLNVQIDASVKALRGNGGTGCEMRLVGLKGVTAPNNRVLIKMDGLGIPPLMMTELFFSSQASTFLITALEFYISYPPLSDHLRHGLTSTFVVCTGGSRGGARRARPLISRPNWGPKGRKKNVFEAGPPPPPISGSGWPEPPLSEVLYPPLVCTSLLRECDVLLVATWNYAYRNLEVGCNEVSPKMVMYLGLFKEETHVGRFLWETTSRNRPMYLCILGGRQRKVLL